MISASRPSPGVLRVLSLVLAMICTAAIAAPDTDDVQAAQVAKSMHRNLAFSFALDKGLALDPKLRAAADQLSADHLARVDQLLPQWFKEERAQQTAKGKALDPSKLYQAVWARLLNELALWQIEPGDADYERATLAVLQTAPRVCLNTGDARYGDFARRILRIQAMPEEQRNAALETERQLLAHWGKARTAVASRPDPMPQDMAISLIKHELADGKRHSLALPPILASDLLGQEKDYPDMQLTVRCVLQQWWLQESLRQGAAPADALNAFRYGTLIDVPDRYAQKGDASPPDEKAEPAPAKPPYPKLASRFMVTGVTTMRVQLDSAGKARQARIAYRKVDVPGIRGVRPIAFETIFDSASMHYALDRRQYDKSSGTAPVSIQLVWSLDDDADSSANTQPGARR